MATICGVSAPFISNVHVVPLIITGNSSGVPMICNFQLPTTGKFRAKTAPTDTIKSDTLATKAFIVPSLYKF
jgi:hypothetical protein